MNAHRDTGEHRQAYTFTGSYHWRQDTGGATPSPPRSYPYRRIPTQEDRTPTQATGSPLLARSPSRSMMMHRKGNEHSQAYRDTDTGETPLQALTIGDHRHRRQARSRSVLSLQENTDTGGTPTGGQEHTGATPSPLLLAPVGSRSLSVYDDTPQRK